MTAAPLLSRLAFYCLLSQVGCTARVEEAIRTDANLIEAVQGGDLADVEKCIKKGADANMPDGQGMTPLMHAVYRGSVEKDIIPLLIESGADLNARRKDGITALLIAIDQPREDEVKILIEAGADPNVPDAEGMTPLMHAINRHYEIDRYLVEHGADMTLVSKSGQTTLMTAVGRGDMEMLELALENGVKANARTAQGESAAHFASAYSAFHHPQSTEADERQKALDMLNRLESAGATLDVQTPDGTSPLHFASRSGYTGTAAFLLRKGLNPNQQSEGLGTPLHAAIPTGQIPYGSDAGLPIAKVLIEGGADVNLVDSKGQTPLIRAVLAANAALVHLLVQNGADPNVGSANGYSTLSLVASRFHGRRMEATDYTRMVQAVMGGSSLADTVDPNKMTPLMWAAASNVPQAVAVLIADGAQIEARSGDGRTPLMWAASANAVETITELLNSGASAQAVDQKGRTAREWALLLDQKEAAKALSATVP